MCSDVAHTCTLNNEQPLGGPMTGWSSCNYECTDGQSRSFIAKTGKCPRFLPVKDKRFKRKSWWNNLPPPIVTPPIRTPGPKLPSGGGGGGGGIKQPPILGIPILM